MVLGKLADRFRQRAGKLPETLDSELPVVWLLGKTGAGKSSLIRCLTGSSEAIVGNGFEPCTRTSQKFDYPPGDPLVRFLDTRGLGEAGYDPTEDLAACRGHSHAILVVCRLDDPVQGVVADALAEVTQKAGHQNTVLVHTGADLIADENTRRRAASTNATQMNKAVGRTLSEVMVTLDPATGGDAKTRDQLVDLLLDVLPEAGLALARRAARNSEEEAFQKVRHRVLFYASIAGSTDLAPVVGAISVPATQMAMLRELGNRYEIPWTRQVMAKFAGALGLSFGAGYLGSYGLRQVGKLVPVYGQTVGAAFAGTISFAVTYALGRTASYYLHVHSRDADPTREDLRAVYASAFKRASHAAD